MNPRNRMWSARGATLVASLLAAVGGAPAAHAGFIGSDNFNDNVADAALWLPNSSTFNGGSFAESNGHTEYTSSAATFSSAHQQWVRNAGSYTDSWSAQIDVHVDNSASSPSNHVGIAGLQVFKTGALQTQADLFFVNNSAIGTFVSGSTIPDIGNPFGRGFGSQATAAVDAALRIEFDASSKILTLLFDVDGGLNGYTWLSLVQADIDAGLASWQMTDSDTFDLYLNAGSFTPTAAGEIYLDNFQAGVPEPTTLSLVMLAGLVGTRRLRGTQHPRERQVENDPAKC